jgi:hypothetical protein
VIPGLLGFHGALGEDVEQLQRHLGDGPTLTAFGTGRPAIALDLASESSRWPAFGPKATAIGITSLFALPLRPHRDPTVVLSLYDTATGPFEDARVGDVLLVGDLVAEALVDPSPHRLRARLGQVGTAGPPSSSLPVSLPTAGRSAPAKPSASYEPRPRPPTRRRPQSPPGSLSMTGGAASPIRASGKAQHPALSRSLTLDLASEH